MNRNDKHLARLIIQQRIHLSTGMAFQDLFSLAMEQSNPNFTKIKPQGPLGDRKNDGYDPNTGTFFQVYGPEELDDIASARKLTADFNGLKKHWNSFSKIKRFVFVVNDRYRGSYPTVEQELATLRTTEAPIEFVLFRAKHLEDVILDLPEEKLLAITGFLGDVTGYAALDVSALGQAVRHILRHNVPDKPDQIPEDPDFEKKLTFNGLSKSVSSRLRAASFQTHIVEEYFHINGAFTKDELKSRFAALYAEANASIPDGGSKADSVFTAIWEKACPDTTFAVRMAVLVLMAHYFEYCDIFETPTPT